MAVTTPFFEFVWLAAFEDSARDLFGEEQRCAVELELLDDPRKGEVIRGTGGLRKLRVRSGHCGKSGGARVIYYFRAAKERIHMITAYAKSERTDLTPHDRAVIRALVTRLRKEE